MVKKTLFQPQPPREHPEQSTTRIKTADFAATQIENASSGCAKYGQVLKRYGKRIFLSQSNKNRGSGEKGSQNVSTDSSEKRRSNIFSRWSCCAFGVGTGIEQGSGIGEPQQTIFRNNNATSSQTETSFTDLSSKLSENEKRDIDSVSIEATLNNSQQQVSLSERKTPQTDEGTEAEEETVAPSDGSVRQTVDSSTVESELMADRDDGPENGQQTLPDPRSPASTLLPTPPVVATHTVEDTSHYQALKPPYQRHQWLLDAIADEDRGKKCLVLDLDETLVHSSFKATPQADMVVPVEIDGTVHNVYVLKRPGVDLFMKRMSSVYEIVIFTASLAKYADPVLDVLDIHRVVQHRLFRESCFNHMGTYVKDLSQLGRNIKEVIILDNSPASYLFHPKNAVPVSSWFNDLHDSELIDMIEFLEELATVNDVTTVLDNNINNTL
ncbi:hypothetical protein INT43_003634 [Umbelopsis isabellina]|uniref:protein-serine/threonine phosphatase n=1 Tax=Mortierella isabellina TaxID=91625 RepID=A0A8H7PU21_MORIS|nr:hypothetical protein INT43_003634 [Umbelopsis isabellina]